MLALSAKKLYPGQILDFTGKSLKSPIKEIRAPRDLWWRMSAPLPTHWGLYEWHNGYRSAKGARELAEAMKHLQSLPHTVPSPFTATQQAAMQQQTAVNRQALHMAQQAQNDWHSKLVDSYLKGYRYTRGDQVAGPGSQTGGGIWQAAKKILTGDK